ncbi:MAG: cytochrome P450 [Ktedonobacteraceae bacterium]|nr:cytochrome P450 [Ktedonobacteraceae bacterium]MBO0791493.1 cytochrome P450 [Ktedonobacteraceae bacterium]
MQPQSDSQAATRFRQYNLTEIPQVYAWFERMRTNQPAIYDEQMHMWQVFRYEDVSAVVTDHSRFSSKPLGLVGSFFQDTLVAKDPPEHRKLRNLVNQAFTPRAVARLSDRITRVTQELLDEVRATGKMDIVSDMAFPLPAKVIAELLGVPSEDWNIFQKWARIGDTESLMGSERSMQEEMSDYFSQLLAERRRSPREDLISALSIAEVDGERLSEQELVSFCTLLLAAGQETTKNLIANFIVCVTDHPELLERLRQEPDLMPTAIEEVLRYLPPVWLLFRMTTTDVELGGQHIPANQFVLAWLASANRDPAQFANPDQFDIQRASNRHMTFGHGIHFCVGAPLARLEAKIVLPMMLEQLKGLQRVEGVPVMADMGIVFVIRSLPVTFQAEG